MRKRNVIFIEQLDYERACKVYGYVVIMRPMGSRLFRVALPEQLMDNKEVVDVVELWSKGIKRNGIYFIRATEEEAICEFAETLFQMDVEALIVSPDENIWQKITLSAN